MQGNSAQSKAKLLDWYDGYRFSPGSEAKVCNLTIKDVDDEDGSVSLGIPNSEISKSLHEGFMRSVLGRSMENWSERMILARRAIRAKGVESLLTRNLKAVFAAVPHEWKITGEREAKRYFLLFISESLAKAGVPNRAIWVTEFGTNSEGHSDTEGAIKGKGFMAHSPGQELVHAEFHPKAEIALRAAGFVEAVEAHVEGLPAQPFAVGPRGSGPVEFDIAVSGEGAGPDRETLALSGLFDGKAHEPSRNPRQCSPSLRQGHPRRRESGRTILDFLDSKCLDTEKPKRNRNFTAMTMQNTDQAGVTRVTLQTIADAWHTYTEVPAEIGADGSILLSMEPCSFVLLEW